MIERQIILQKIKEERIEESVMSFLGRLSCSKVKLQRTPLGEKITVYTSKPGLIVGRKGANIKELTRILKEEFKLENPQIEVAEIDNPNLDSASIAKSLVAGFERFGPKRFKAMAYKALENVMRSGALGIEIVISGRGIPSTRAKTWRFMAGYLKKSGDIAENYVDKAHESCNLRSGTIGIKIRILKSDVRLPDFIIDKTKKETVEEIKNEVEEIKGAVKKETIKQEDKLKEKIEEEKPKKTKTKKVKIEDGEDKKE